MALKPRLVVVGVGSIGLRHARLLGARGDIAVEWCEPDAGIVIEAVRDLGAPSCIHRDFKAMLATMPDMVVLATPHQLHAEQSIQALAAGVHVLCEKPMADHPQAAREMLAAAAASGRVLSIGFHLHFHPGLRRLKDLMAAGELGTIAHVHCRVGSYVTLENSRSRYQRLLEGALMLDYAHQADLLHWLLQAMPLGVYAAGAHLKTPELHSNPNVLSLNFDYAQPVLGTIHLNYLQAPERHEYEVVGDRGWAVVDLSALKLTLGLKEGARSWTESIEVSRDSLYLAEHEAFIAAVSGVAVPENPPGEAIASVYMTAAAQKSWKSRQRVELSSI